MSLQPYTSLLIRSTDVRNEVFTLQSGFDNIRAIEMKSFNCMLTYDNISAAMGNNVLKVEIDDEEFTVTFPDGIYTVGSFGTTDTTDEGNGPLNFWTVFKNVWEDNEALSTEMPMVSCGWASHELKAEISFNPATPKKIAFYSNLPLLGLDTGLLYSITIGSEETWQSPGAPSNDTIKALRFLFSECYAVGQMTSTPGSATPVLHTSLTNGLFLSMVKEENTRSTFWLQSPKQVQFFRAQLLTDTGRVAPPEISWTAELLFYK